MATDLNNFTNTLPYASELFGIYQPLIGWQSKLSKQRIENVSRDAMVRLLGAQLEYWKHRKAAGKSDELFSPDVLMNNSYVKIPHFLDSFILRKLLFEHRTKRKKTSNKTIHIFSDAKSGDHMKMVKDWVTQSFLPVDREKLPKHIQPIATRRFQDLNHITSKDYFVQEQMKHESIVLGYLQWLAKIQPKKFDAIFNSPNDDLTRDASLFMPQETFTPTSMSAVLSPIGIVHLFRQYYFEFDSFLGSPAGHFWLPPGGTLELVEVHSRKILTEHFQESSSEFNSASEKSLLVDDEISEAVKQENQQDLSLGFSASANYTVPTFEGGAQSSVNLNLSKSTARETAHKTNRQQSEKISSQIKRSFKSTFRVSNESSDTNSKRYVLQNNSERIMNYELKRKMRRIGVQVQDIGSQLCWQVFVDNPGSQLGIAQMIHVAAPADLSSIQPPQAPVLLQKQSVDLTVQFPFEATVSNARPKMNETYYQGSDNEGDIVEAWLDTIVWKRNFKAQGPAPGYTMDSDISYEVNHSGIVAAKMKKLNDDGLFEISLEQVNFKNQPVITFQVKTTWSPPDQTATQQAYEQQVTTYTEEQQRRVQEALVEAAKERVTLASRISSRNFSDLRQEERITIYRKLISQLFSAVTIQDNHLLSEMVRAIFDVDKMLYFVAPEWWQPRQTNYGQEVGIGDELNSSNSVSWGGANESRPNNYYITDESQPAKLGASLGWLLQLDGDNFRNAFLNSPWVKAVIPIRPGKEKEAIEWLSHEAVEGSDGLDSLYNAASEELLQIHPDGSPVKLKEALIYLADQLSQQQDALNTLDPSTKSLPAEKVFQNGFDPLEGSFVPNSSQLNVFSQWTEILPTDQMVAAEYGNATS